MTLRKLTFTIAMLFSLAATVAQAQIKTKYDKFDDRTEVRVRSVLITRSNGDPELFISAHQEFSGRSPNVKPETIYLMFGPQFLSGNAQLQLLVDGERLIYEDDRVSRGIAGFRIPYETFVKIINAGSVEGRVQFLEFTLDSQAKSRLREFLQYITP